MEQQHSLEHLCFQFFDESGLSEIVGGPDAVRSGLQQLQIELLRISLDLQSAKANGQSISEAVVDFERYPKLSQVHAAFDDALRWAMPPKVIEWARRALNSPAPAVVDVIRTKLIEMATEGPTAIHRGLCEWLLFEAVRLNLLVVYHSNAESMVEHGISSSDMSERAEDSVNQWLATASVSSKGTRPFHVLVAGALLSLTRYVEEVRTALTGVRNDYRLQAIKHARFERLMDELDPTDAMLIRNDCAPDLGEPQFSVELLLKRRPHLSQGRTRNALDQRNRRIKKKIKAGDIAGAKRKQPAIISLLVEQYDKEIKAQGDC